MPYIRPDHEDAEQLEYEDDGMPAGFRWWTFCTCGQAFGGATADEAYERWEQHEADAS